MVEVRDGCSGSEPCDRCYGIGSELNGVSLGRILVKLREKVGLSQRAVADGMGVSAQYVNDMEHGRRRLSYRQFQAYLKVLWVS